MSKIFSNIFLYIGHDELRPHIGSNKKIRHFKQRIFLYIGHDESRPYNCQLFNIPCATAVQQIVNAFDV